MRTAILFVMLIAVKAFPSEKLPEIFSQTTHETNIDGNPIVYTATVGSIAARSTDGKESGQIYYISYRKVADDPARPITFAFNGGPGSSSVWLHLGALGPKRVLSHEEGQSIVPPYQMIENNESILDLTDLVFIDPIGTGFSRASETEKEKSFYSPEGDISAVGDFIRDFLTQEGRWASPKYIAGESYGTFRACGVSEYLLSRHGIFLNGLILISCVLDFQTISFGLDNELPYSLFLPSYATAAWFHGRLDQTISLEETASRAREFALHTLAPAILKFGKVPPDLFPAIACWSGLSISEVERLDGLIDDTSFFLHFFGTEKKVIGRFDSRAIGDILIPKTAKQYEDPAMTPVLGVFTAAMHSYLAHELGCKSDWPRYEILSDLPWDFKGYSYPNTLKSLRKALVLNPEMRVFTACGYFDLATPFAAVEHCFNRLHLPLGGNVAFGYYEGGHMFYTNPAALQKFKSDLRRFIK